MDNSIQISSIEIPEISLEITQPQTKINIEFNESFDAILSQHNHSDNAHFEVLNPIKEKILTIPNKISDLENDMGFTTLEQIPQNLSQLDNDKNFVTQEFIPTKISQLLNDNNYCTTENISTLADKNLSNISVTGKNTISKIPIPEYSKGITKSWGTTYTAEKNGWIKIQPSVSENTDGPASKLYLYIDGTNIGYWHTRTPGSQSNFDSTVLFPISKSQTFLCTGGNTNVSLIFYPCIGES